MTSIHFTVHGKDTSHFRRSASTYGCAVSNTHRGHRGDRDDDDDDDEEEEEEEEEEGVPTSKAFVNWLMSCIADDKGPYISPCSPRWSVARRPRWRRSMGASSSTTWCSSTVRRSTAMSAATRNAPRPSSGPSSPPPPLPLIVQAARRAAERTSCRRPRIT